MGIVKAAGKLAVADLVAKVVGAALAVAAAVKAIKTVRKGDR